MSDVSLPQTMIFGHVWQSVALAAVLAGVLILGRRMRGSTRYGLATAAFAASLLLPLAAFIPGETIVASLLKQLNAPVMLASSAPAQIATPVTPVTPATPAAAVTRTDPLLTPVSFERDATSLGLGIATTVAPVVNAAPAAPLFTLPEIKLPDVTLPLLAIWLAGASLLLFRTGRDLIAVERLVARAKPADLPEALKGCMKGVRVVVSPEAPGPMAAGLFRPAIVLPESIALASPGMAGLLEHEHAHIRRRDMLAALGQRIVIALLWWSPALHWMSRRIDEEREVACDEAAVDRTGDAKAFARSLTKQAENQLWVRAPKLAVGAIGPRSHFGRRVKRLIEIAKTGGHPAKYSGRLAFAGLALCVAVAAMITPRFTAEAQPPADRGTVDLTSPEARDQARAAGELDGGSDHSFNFTFDGDEDFAMLGKDISELMNTIMPEIEMALSQLTPELQGELSALSAEMSALGVDISSTVTQEVLREMPAIMDQVRQSLQEAGIDPDHIDDWQGFSDFDAEEVRQAMEEAREELKHALGPEMQAEIRRALAEAREEVASHREEIAAAMRESHNGLAIAREALAAAKAEIEAARARGDFNPDKIKFDFDLKDLSNIHGPGRNNSPAYKLFHAADDCEAAEVNRLIVEEKADVNAIFLGEGSPLMAAADDGCIDAARTLINAGADVNKGFPGQGTPLSIAAEDGSVQVAQLLLNRGADVNKSVPGADTPLVEAAADGDLAMVKLLVEAGANVNLVSKVGNGRSPLQTAMRHGNDEIAAYLHSKGATEGRQ